MVQTVFKAPQKTAKLTQMQEIEVFYDGACPLCKREIDWLRKKDTANRIIFTDISNPDFEAEPTGKTYQELMARIHGRLPSGQLIEGVEVFRRLYAAVGYKTLVSLSRWPVVRTLLDLGYRVFAPIRTRLPGRHCRQGSCTTMEE